MQPSRFGDSLFSRHAARPQFPVERITLFPKLEDPRNGLRQPNREELSEYRLQLVHTAQQTRDLQVQLVTLCEQTHALVEKTKALIPCSFDWESVWLEGRK